MASISFVAMQQRNGSRTRPQGIWALDFSPDDRFIVSGGDDSTLRIYNGKNYQLYKQYKINGVIRNLDWHPSGKMIAIATLKDVQLFDVNTGEFNILPGIPGARGMAWNSNGELLGVAGGRGMVYVLTKEGQLLRTIPKHDNKSYLAMDWSVNNIIATGSDEVILFDTTGRQVSFIEHRKEYRTGVLTVRWHPSGDFFVTGDYGHANEGIPTTLQFRKEDGTLLRIIGGHNEEIRNARWNSDGSLLATASDSLRLYNSKGDLIATGKAPGKYDLWNVEWSNDGKTIITSSYAANHLDVWDNKGNFLKQVY